jgi:hypothetical protein
MQTPIDLRSDTVTRPTLAMREAMMAAPLGDDVLGDDPTILALQDKFAALVGKESSLFVPSGTMANQLAIRSQTEPGDEIICHEDSHIIHYETGGPAAISGCMIPSAAPAAHSPPNTSHPPSGPTMPTLPSLASSSSRTHRTVAAAPSGISVRSRASLPPLTPAACAATSTARVSGTPTSPAEFQ